MFGDVLKIQAWACLRRHTLASGIRFGFGRFVVERESLVVVK